MLIILFYDMFRLFIVSSSFWNTFYWLWSITVIANAISEVLPYTIKLPILNSLKFFK
jgi:hypothetical protein